MFDQSATAETSFGYLAMLEFAEYGYFGGYLIVSLMGRPLEFHCTAPIRPSRAQRILYGATLEPFLLGEQISSALLKAAKSKPDLIIANHEATLQACSSSGVQMVLLCGNSDSPGNAIPQSSPVPEAADASTPGLVQDVPTPVGFGTFTVSSRNFQLPPGCGDEQSKVTELLAKLARHVEIAEPFDRIAEAIREAQRLGSTGAEPHDQAA